MISNKQDSPTGFSILEEELNHIWSRPFLESPVTKDLPRLAGRITIEGNFSGVPNKTNKIEIIETKVDESLPEVTLRDFFLKESKELVSDPQNIEHYCKVLENEYYCYVDGSLLLIPDEKWKEFDIPEHVIKELKMRAAKVKTVQRQLEERLSEKSGSRPLSLRLSFDSPSATSVDRIQIIPEPNDIPEVRNMVAMKEVAKVIMGVAQRLEESQKVKELKDYIQQILLKENFSDLEFEVADIFEKLGVESKTAKLFQAIHQNIIFAAVFQLKVKVPNLTLTRDVRTREGWRISVVFSNNIVTVIHRRREQSLATAPSDEQFWFEWELRILFDQQMTKLHSAMLRITDLGFSENINPKKT